MPERWLRSPVATDGSGLALADNAREFRLRTVSTLVLAPIAIAAVWLGGWPFRALVILIGAGVTAEWAGLCRGPGGLRG